MDAGIASIVVGVLALIGTIVGYKMTSANISSLVEYKIDQLQKQVEKHNQVIARTYALEEKVSVMEAEDKRQNHRLEVLENEVK